MQVSINRRAVPKIARFAMVNWNILIPARNSTVFVAAKLSLQTLPALMVTTYAMNVMVKMYLIL